MEIERKVLPLRQFKMIEDGAGGFTAYPSVFGELDSTGDIVLPGGYADGLAEFLSRGFTAHSHDWSYDGVVGYPVAAKEDAYGLYAESRFHSTPDAQAVRTKMAERHAAGLDVLLSIGYQATGAQFLTPAEYATELPKYCRPDHLPEALAKAAQFPRIRLLSKIRLYEYSVVTVPALASARATGVKAMDETQEATAEAPVDAEALSLKTFEEHSEALGAALSAWTERASWVRELRTKQGRTLSQATRTRMGAIRDTMRECAAGLDAMMEEPAEEETGKASVEEVQQALARFAALQARQLGVPV